MNKALQTASAAPEQPQRDDQRPTRLSECGDTLGVWEVTGVLGISDRQLRTMRAHGVFPEPLPGLGCRWGKAVVQRFIDGAAAVGLGAKRYAGSR